MIQYVTLHRPGKKISEAAQKIAANGITTYEAQVNGKDMIFNSKGEFLKK